MLQQMKVALLPASCDNTLTENPWILVDSDGEEVTNQFHLLNEILKNL